MAQTTGLVQSLTVSLNIEGTANSICVWIGASSGNAELLTVTLASTDDAATLALKGNMIDALSAALVSRGGVTASHDDNSATLTQLVVNPA